MSWWLQDLSLDTRLVYPNAYLKTFLRYLVDTSNFTWQKLPPSICSSGRLSSPLSGNSILPAAQAHSLGVTPKSFPSLTHHFSSINKFYQLFLQNISRSPATCFHFHCLSPSPTWNIAVASYNGPHPCWKQMAYPTGVTEENLIKREFIKVWTG